MTQVQVRPLHVFGDPKMMIGTGGNKGLVGHTKHLMAPGKTVQKVGHGGADAATHTAWAMRS
nr:hypothetical protein [Candidatus Synechococcus spongiarum]